MQRSSLYRAAGIGLDNVDIARGEQERHRLHDTTRRKHLSLLVNIQSP